jgi:Tfp pilus assembly protein PilX
MAIIVTLILALIVAGIAQVTVADFEMNRLTRWDATAQYLAQAGAEHQIYALKANKDAGAIAYTNFPVTTDQRYWYTTILTCLLNCSGSVAVRRWRIQSTGEIRQYNGGTYTVLQTRSIAVQVDITYDGVAPNLYTYPQRVTLQRWEETLP